MGIWKSVVLSQLTLTPAISQKANPFNKKFLRFNKLEIPTTGRGKKSIHVNDGQK